MGALERPNPRLEPRDVLPNQQLQERLRCVRGKASCWRTDEPRQRLRVGTARALERPNPRLEPRDVLPNQQLQERLGQRLVRRHEQWGPLHLQRAVPIWALSQCCERAWSVPVACRSRRTTLAHFDGNV